MEAIKLHERLDDIAPQLSSVKWCALRLLRTVLDLRTSLMNVLDGL